LVITLSYMSIDSTCTDELINILIALSSRLLSKLIPHVLNTLPSGKKACRVADVGGGTGNFTAALAEQLKLGDGEHILCVDPFEEMLKHAYVHQPQVQPVLLGAVEFSQTDQTLDCILLKEVIHHIPKVEWGTLFSGCFKQLHGGGKVVIVTRPQEVEYPLFPRAAEIWREHQPPCEPFCEALRLAGFSVQVEINSYLVKLQKKIWLGMVANRFWSTFSHCSDEELSEGIAFLEARHTEEMLTFNDNLLFIVATKPATP
jgi:ubiquinone/menaquinone biosynthesis C-methylase UbiE